MNFEKIYYSLQETITKLEGKPRKSISEERFVKWSKGLDETSKSAIKKAMKRIHQQGLYGSSSHEEQGKPGLFGISINGTTLRIYFTEINDEYIRLEGGSSSKNGAGHNSDQSREIEAIWKIVQARRMI
jgi:hypothetical protein